MSLNLNQILQNKYPHLEISVLNLSDAMRDNEKLRIDAEFFSKEFVNNYKKIYSSEFAFLGDCIITLTDYHANGSYEILNQHVTIKDEKDFAYMIRSTDFEKMDFENEIKYVSKSAYDFLHKTKLFGGEVLINKIGNPGRTYYMPFLNKPTTLGMNLFLLKPNDKINSAYLYVFLNTRLGKSIIERKINGAVPQTIDKKAIKSLPIPLFPLEFQQQIEQMVKESHLCLEQSKALYREAEVLLYRELGLDPENPLASIETHSGSLNISVRPLSQSLNATGRLDSEYYQQKYDEIERIIKNQKFAKLSDLVNMQKSIEPGSEAYQEKGIPFIRVSNFNKFGISDTDIFLDFAEFNQIVKPKKETILLSKDGSIGIAYCVKDDGNFITSSALLHLNIKGEKQREILPEYLTLILNSILVKLQAERDSGGSIIAHWRISEIEQILIPILDISIQEKIENLIKQSFTLRKKASELLQTAKQSVENAIEKG